MIKSDSHFQDQAKVFMSQGGRLKTRDKKAQDWKTWDQIAGVENAGLENKGPNRRGGNAGLENTGTSFVWVARRNIITVLR